MKNIDNETANLYKRAIEAQLNYYRETAIRRIWAVLNVVKRTTSRRTNVYVAS